MFSQVVAISVALSPDDAIPYDPDDEVDIDASMTRLAEQVESALRRAYPRADLRVKALGGGDTSVTVTLSDPDEDDYPVTQHVEYVIDREWNRGENWVVIRKGA